MADARRSLVADGRPAPDEMVEMFRDQARKNRTNADTEAWAHYWAGWLDKIAEHKRAHAPRDC